MAILGAVIVPHPPLIIPTVGRGRGQEVQTTIDAYRTTAKQVAVWEPEVLIITSPHQVMYADYFHISPGRGAAGDMSAFGAPQPGRWESGTRLWTTAPSCPCISSGRPGGDRPILRIGLSRSSPLDHYWLGQCIAQSVEALDRCAVFIASGELSHKLREDGPYGFAPEGPEFDRQITEAMAAGDLLRSLTMDPALCDRAAECGLRSFQIMAGALDGLAMESKLLSYEGVTGVGYGVATFTVTGPDEDRRFGERCAELERTRLAEKKVSEDAWDR